jgi:hypothetical protein
MPISEVWALSYALQRKDKQENPAAVCLYIESFCPNDLYPLFFLLFSCAKGGHINSQFMV